MSEVSARSDPQGQSPRGVNDGQAAEFGRVDRDLRDSLQRQVELVDGILNDTFVLCQSLPLADLPRFDALMKSAGYEPCRLQPYKRLEIVLVAGIWKKGQPEGQWEANLTLEQLAGSDEKAGRAGSVLVDIAGYRDAAGDRYLAVWSKKGHGFQNRFLAGVDVTDDDARAAWNALVEKGFFPLVVNCFHATPGGMPLSAVVAPDAGVTPAWSSNYGNCEFMAETSRSLAATYRQTDASFCYPTGKRGDEWYAAVWHERSDLDCVTADGEPAELRRRGLELASDGYLPAAISLASPDGEAGTYGVCLWHRPINVEDVVAEARQAAAAGKSDALEVLEQAARAALLREDFSAARRARDERLILATKLYGESHWKVTDARLDLSDLDALSKMSSEQRISAAAASRLARDIRDLFDRTNDREVWPFAERLMLLPRAERLVEERKKQLGEEHRDYVFALNLAAESHRRLGQFAWRPESTAVNLAAEAIQRLGDHRQAEPLYRQALEIRKKVLGENHPEYAASLTLLASLYAEQGDYARAEPLCRQALEIYKNVLGENDPDYATSLANLAVLYQDQDDYARAEPLCRQALEIRKKLLGENHPDYANSLNTLACLYDNQGDYPRAESLYCQALEIYKKVLGENCPNYATTLNNLACLYETQGDDARAEPLRRQALEIDKEVKAENPDYARRLNNLVELYQSQGDDARAESHCPQAQELDKEVPEETCRDYVTRANDLIGLDEAQGDDSRAEPPCPQAPDIRKTVPGENRVQVGGVYSVARAKGSFGVVKVVAQDEQNTIYARIFGSHFRVRPEAEWFENREPGKLVEELRIGIGVLPVTQRVFDFWQPMLLLSQAITEEEQENLGECLGVAQAWDDLIYP